LWLPPLLLLALLLLLLLLSKLCLCLPSSSQSPAAAAVAPFTDSTLTRPCTTWLLAVVCCGVLAQVPFPRMHFLLSSLAPLAAPRDVAALTAPRSVDQVGDPGHTRYLTQNQIATACYSVL
jgi:hypothetical protein